MSIFSKTDPQEKAAKKAEKKRRQEIITARETAINNTLGKVEKLNHIITITSAAEALTDDETVLTAMTGDYSGKNACMVLTDHRIIIAYGIGAGIVELPYTDIDRVDVGRKLNGSWVAFHNAGQTTTVNKSTASDKKCEEVKRVVRDQQQTTVGSVPTVDADQLSKLAELHASGVLTDEEFTAAKAKALGL
jgi:hypothetical protein